MTVLPISRFKGSGIYRVRNGTEYLEMFIDSFDLYRTRASYWGQDPVFLRKWSAKDDNAFILKNLKKQYICPLK